MKRYHFERPPVRSVLARLPEVKRRMEAYRLRGWRFGPADNHTILRIARAEHAEELAKISPLPRVSKASSPFPNPQGE